MTTRQLLTSAFAAVLLIVVLCACHATGPISSPVVAGIGASIAVLDQLLAGGVIDQVQHFQLVEGFKGVQAIAQSAQAGVELVKQQQAGQITSSEAITAGGGLLATAIGTTLGIVRAQRGKPRAKTA